MIEHDRVFEHHIVDLRRAREIAAGEAHFAHRIDDRARTEIGDINMLDRAGQKLGLVRVYSMRSVSGTLCSKSVCMLCSNGRRLPWEGPRLVFQGMLAHG